MVVQIVFLFRFSGSIPHDAISVSVIHIPTNHSRSFIPRDYDRNPFFEQTWKCEFREISLSFETGNLPVGHSNGLVFTPFIIIRLIYLLMASFQHVKTTDKCYFLVVLLWSCLTVLSDKSSRCSSTAKNSSISRTYFEYKSSVVENGKHNVRLT